MRVAELRKRTDRLLRRLGFSLPVWVAPGLLGGACGGSAAAWLLWGWPGLLRRGICFPLALLLAALGFALGSAAGLSLVLTAQTVVKAIRRLRRPTYFAMYEPQEPIPELEVMSWPSPGCGLWMLVPILGISAVTSIPWLWFAFRHLPVWLWLLSMVLGLPWGLLMARSEVRRRDLPIMGGGPR